MCADACARACVRARARVRACACVQPPALLVDGALAEADGGLEGVLRVVRLQLEPPRHPDLPAPARGVGLEVPY